MHRIKYTDDDIQGDANYFKCQTYIVQYLCSPMMTLMVDVEDITKDYGDKCRDHLSKRKTKITHKKLGLNKIKNI